MVVDLDLFEDDIEQAQRGVGGFSTPLTAIDTQNRIWLKIITREKQNYDAKKQTLRKHAEPQMLVIKKQERMARVKTENAIWKLASRLARAGMYIP